MTEQTTSIRVLAAADGMPEAGIEGVADRFMIVGEDTGGRFALVQHVFPPRALAAPMHRHHQEDEYTYVLTGRIGAVIDDREVVASPGDLLFKPRGQWHTFWNAGDEPASCLEMISPAGLEDLFKAFAGLTAPPGPDQLAEMAAAYRCDLDFDATMPLVEKHGLSF